MAPVASARDDPQHRHRREEHHWYTCDQVTSLERIFTTNSDRDVSIV
jgi:hypothetical protein